MKRLFAALVLVSFALCISGCKKSPEAIAEEFVGLMEKIANAVDANKADCDKMAGEVDKLITSNKKLIDQAMAMKKDKGQDKKLEEKYKERMKGIMTKMMGGMMKCAKNKKLAEAMKKLR